MTNHPVQPVRTGLDLKIERLRRHVQAKALAVELGVGRTRVSNIEALGRPSVEAIERYLDALDRVAS